jgi:hypothetical protein
MTSSPEVNSYAKPPSVRNVQTVRETVLITELLKQKTGEATSYEMGRRNGFYQDERNMKNLCKVQGCQKRGEKKVGHPPHRKKLELHMLKILLMEVITEDIWNMTK